VIYNGDSGLSDLAETVERTVADLRPHADKFDSIAVTGMSGVVVGSPVSLALGKPLVIVRKKTDDAHHKAHVNRTRAGERVLFLDDFVESGETRARVEDAIERNGSISRVTAQYLYGRWDGKKGYEERPTRATAPAPFVPYYDPARYEIPF
jgi:adenine/guanine phosphoribosyltransferase-like PRPP-binding protein